MRRSGPPKRKTPLASTGRVNPVNRERRAEKHARNFGGEADAVRAMPCLCFAVGHHQMVLRARGRTDMDHMTPCSNTGVVAAHVTARGKGGAKGGRFDLVPLCTTHHDEAGEARTSQRAAFEARYGLDLRAEADRIALEHEPPLGIRGLARLAADGIEDVLGSAFVDGLDMGMVSLSQCIDITLDAYEGDALLGWVRRECEREVERRRAAREHQERIEPSWDDLSIEDRSHDGLADNDREALAHHVALALGGPFAEDHDGAFGLAWTLCEAAGWPS